MGLTFDAVSCRMRDMYSRFGRHGASMYDMYSRFGRHRASMYDMYSRFGWHGASMYDMYSRFGRHGQREFGSEEHQLLLQVTEVLVAPADRPLERAMLQLNRVSASNAKQSQNWKHFTKCLKCMQTFTPKGQHLEV